MIASPAPIGSPAYPLDMVAALSGDGRRLILSVVNPTEEDQEFAPRVSGVRLRGPGTLWQIAAPSVDARNIPGQEPVVEIIEYPQEELSGTVQVPRLNISVYEFEIENS